MTFYSGQKVVCVNAARENVDAFWRAMRRIFSRDWPVEGQIYTVVRPHVEVIGIDCIELFEIKNSRLMKYAFWRDRFRPLVQRETDISAFTEILRTTKAPREGVLLTSHKGQSHD